MDIQDCQTLAETAQLRAQYTGDATAFIYDRRRLSFRDLNAHANQVANGLLAEDIGPGARVAFLAKDSEASYEIFFGTVKAKAVFVPINWRLAAQEVLHILSDSQCELLFVGEEYFSMVEQLQDQLQGVRKIIAVGAGHSRWPEYLQWRSGQTMQTPALEYRPADVVTQIYTSGTTGRPKGVQLANYSFFSLMQGMREQGDSWMDLVAEDRLLLSLPSFHIGGLWWVVQGFISGACGVIMDAFVAWKALELIERYKLTKIIMVPAMIQFTLAESTCNQTDFSSVKGLLYGGSPIAPALLRKAMQTFACDFFQIYGMTETGNMAVCLRPEDHNFDDAGHTRATGRALPGVEVKVIDREGRPLKAGKSGEICIKSPSNMVGYWNNPQATRDVLVDGWVHTGDAGYMDEAGYIYVCDRIKDMVIYGGENIFPAEIEAAICEHDAVAEAAVIGIPDERWGETVMAFIVLHSGESLKSRDIAVFLRGKIADYKVPKSVSFVDTLPRNPSGKILKKVLREPFWKGQDRQVS